MNRKLRVLMLSVFAVLFAVSSAFAFTSADLTAASFDVVATNENPATMEGYSYYQTVVASWDQSKLSSKDVTISWDVHADTGEDYTDIDFLTWTLNSFDVEIEGVLPAYVDEASYLLHVIAHVYSGDKWVYSRDVSDNAGLDITVEEDPIPAASHDIYNFTSDLVSVDATSADGNIYTVTDGYSVTITFATQTSGDEGTLPHAELAYDADTKGVAEGLYLPSWLAYEATPDTEDAYVTKLRIFYSADTKPEAGTEGSVRIVTSLSSGFSSADLITKYADYMADSSDGSLVMGWEVSISPAISFDVTEASYDIKYGTSTDVGSADLVYHYQTPVSVTFSPDISADLSIDWSYTESVDTANAKEGYITLTVTPVTPLATTYSTDMIVTDSYDNTATVTLYFTVSMDAMYISPDVASASVTVDTGKSADVTFTAYNFNGKVLSWDLGTIPSGITVTSSDSGDYGEMLTVTVIGQLSGDYSFDVKATDSFDRTASTVMYVKVLSPDVPGPGGLGLKVDPVSKSITVKAGGDIVDVTFRALDASGDVAWSFGTLPDGVTMVEANASGDRPVSFDNSVTYGVRAASTVAARSYNVTITASDDVKKATATLTIIVSSDVVPPASLTISPSAPSVSVAVGASTNVTLTASNNSGLVEWTLGTVPSGVTVAVATDTSYATQYMTTMVYTVTGVTAGSYSVPVTAKDAGGNTATATISVTVTGSGGGGSTPTITPTPTFSLTEAVQSKIRNALIAALGSIISSSTRVVTLPASAFTGEPRAVGTTAIYLPEIRVSEDAIYVFNVNVATFTTGYTMVWEVTVASSETDELIQASAEEKNAIFLNDDGDIITTVPANKSVNVAAYFEAGKTYSPVIRATATAPDTGKTGVGSSSGGCSAGLGALVSVLAAAFFISKKRA